MSSENPQMQEPRRHHWVSKFYLDFFAHSPNPKKPKTKLLEVFDLVNKKRFPASTKDVARGYDYFTLHEAQDKYAAETAFSKLEGVAGTNFKSIQAQAISSQGKFDFHKAAELGNFLDLLSLLAARTPDQRKHREDVSANMAMARFRKAVGNTEFITPFLEGLASNGELDDSVENTLATLREAATEDEIIEVKFTSTQHVLDELAIASDLRANLENRIWRCIPIDPSRQSS